MLRPWLVMIVLARRPEIRRKPVFVELAEIAGPHRALASLAARIAQKAGGDDDLAIVDVDIDVGQRAAERSRPCGRQGVFKDTTEAHSLRP
ncbi:hypothetical protein ACRAWD_27205 [Caulobacter segnis]